MKFLGRENRYGNGYSQGAHGKNVNAVAFSPDAKKLVSASGDKTVKVRDISTDK